MFRRWFLERRWQVFRTRMSIGFRVTPVMGAANLQRSLTSLHTETESLVWIKCVIRADKRDVSFFTDCSDLVNIMSSLRNDQLFCISRGYSEQGWIFYFFFYIWLLNAQMLKRIIWYEKFVSNRIISHM